MSDNEDTRFERRAAQLLRASADELDGAARARLARARHAALAATGPPSWFRFRYLAPAGATAGAVLVALLFIGREPVTRVNDVATSALYDMELLADADAWELVQEADLEFIEWAAEIARQEGPG